MAARAFRAGTNEDQVTTGPSSHPVSKRRPWNNRTPGAGNDPHQMGLSLLQYVGNSLQGGPRGIHPPTHIAALAAIAGYGAKFGLSLKISRGELPDDFERVACSRTKSIVVSEQVNRVLLSMDQTGFAGIVISGALRCGLTNIPDINGLLQSHLSRSPAPQPVCAGHQPDLPDETLLMMYWESVARFFRKSPSGFETVSLAAAYATSEAVSIYRNSVPVDAAVVIAMQSAIAMSKVDRAF